MQVSTGSRLGPYEIVSPLGSGGMGEVWKARDTRLDRSVAIKILPAEFARNAQLRIRFEREAKTISQLEHPHICRLYDVGRTAPPEGGTASRPIEDEDADAPLNYLVMELLEGESLAERLTRGPLPLNEVLKYGAQIADALDRAHRAGVVHRDLKPGNIMITKSGAKLLDFGLAKTGAVVDLDGATVQKQLTQEGTILGTFQYMAPEQLEGQEADARTDIFAFGAVLYEMATGRRAFEGKTKTSLIAAIVKEQPRPLSQIQPLTPPALEHVIAKCLEKDREDRWQSARDIGEQLRFIASAASTPSFGERRRWSPGVTQAIAVVATLAAVIFATLYFRASRTPRERIETELASPDGNSLSSIDGAMAFSPDGRRLAFVAVDDSRKRAIWLRDLRTGHAGRLGGTEGAASPFWSPDGAHLGFVADRKLKRIPVAGGAASELADASYAMGATWSPNGTILFAPSFFGPIMQVPQNGGPVKPATNKPGRSPHFLPDGDHFLYLSIIGYGQFEGIAVGSLRSGQSRVILPGVFSNALYAAPGHLIYSRDGILFAQKFDPDRLTLSGEPVRLAEQVAFDAERGAVLAAAAGERSLAFLIGESRLSRLISLDSGGKTVAQLGKPANQWSARVSNDGTRVAVDISDVVKNTGDIWVFDIESGVPARLTYDSADESAPVWSPDDSTIAFFRRNRAGGTDVYSVPSNGSGEPQILFPGGNQTFLPQAWSPDGQSILASRILESAADLYVISLARREARPWLQTPFLESAAALSPDGTWVAYSSDESGRFEVYLRPFSSAHSGKRIISRNGGWMPVWSRDGRSIFYQSLENDAIVRVAVSSGAATGAAPEKVLSCSIVQADRIRQYDLLRDGTFLVVAPSGEERPRAMKFVQNWTAGSPP